MRCGRRAACSTHRRSADRRAVKRHAGRRRRCRRAWSETGLTEAAMAVSDASAGQEQRTSRRCFTTRRCAASFRRSSSAFCWWSCLVDPRQHRRKPQARQHRLGLRLPEWPRRLRYCADADPLSPAIRPICARCMSAYSTRSLLPLSASSPRSSLASSSASRGCRTIG